jgi:hypothetical protein
MAKRFTDTMKWNEDWYLDLSLSNKLFWIYICDNCNHAGIFKPNKRMFELLLGDNINIETFLKLINKDKLRICVLGNKRWYLTGFIEFQYGKKINPINRVHKSILKVLNENDVSTKEIDDLEIVGVSNVTPNPISIPEVVTYFQDKGSNKKEAERFFYYYESQGWKVGKNPMKNWKMAASGWILRNSKNKPDSSYLDSQLDAMKK